MLTLAELQEKSKVAVVVWCALCNVGFEQGSTHFFCRRRGIARRAGFKNTRTITNALKTLEKAEWLVKKVKLIKLKGKIIKLLSVHLLMRPENTFAAGSYMPYVTFYANTTKLREDKPKKEKPKEDTPKVAALPREPDVIKFSS